MKRITYFDSYTECEILVEEMNKKEAIEYTEEFIDGIEGASYSTDTSVFVEYKDGSFYSNIDGDKDGKFRKTNIKGIILDDGYEYYIFGEYEMTENVIPELV